MAILKAIIFDFDGVLAESMNIKADAFASIFREYPKHVNKIVKLHMDNGGMTRYRKFRIIYEDYLKKEYNDSIERELDRQFSLFVKQAVIECPEVKGAREFLQSYHKKTMLFVASGAPQKELINIVKKRGLYKYFKGIYGSPLDKIIIVKNILKKYKFKPDEVVLVGDAINDYRAAEKSGVKFIARIEKNKPNPFRGLKGVDGLIYDINGLKKSINKIFPDFI